MSAPDHSIKVWLEADEIHCEISSPVDGARAHSFFVPATQAGFAVFVSVLKERERVSYNHQLIGTAAAPVQYDIEGIMRAMGSNMTGRLPPRRLVEAPSDLKLEDLDL